MVASVPALAVGDFWIIRIFVSVDATVHGETADAVKVKVTVPALRSFVPGVYIGVSELVELKVPFPEVDQRILNWF